MNLWKCQHPECTHTAVGCGGAVGLRAIGWYFRLGPVILCPQHRPDGRLCTRPAADVDPDPACGLCTAETDAMRYQRIIEEHTYATS